MKFCLKNEFTVRIDRFGMKIILYETIPEILSYMTVMKSWKDQLSWKLLTASGMYENISEFI